MPPTLDVVIVAWNHGDTLPACVDALNRVSRANFTLHRIVVVDNASAEPVPLASMDAPGAIVIRNAGNRGFAPACNQGAESSCADYLLFLNPDTRVGRDSLASAIAFLERPGSARIGLAGLPLADANGVVQPTCGRMITPKRLISQTLGLHLLAPSYSPGFRMTEWDHATTRRVDFASGAALLVRRAVFHDLGGFNPRFVVYLEDADLAQRAARAGWDTWFLACEPVEHRNGWRSGRRRSWRLAQSWRSAIRYGWKHFSRPGAIAAALAVAGAAPVARLVHATVRGAWQDAADTAGAWLTFWRLLIGHARSVSISVAASRTSLPPA